VTERGREEGREGGSVLGCTQEGRTYIPTRVCACVYRHCCADIHMHTHCTHLCIYTCTQTHTRVDYTEKQTRTRRTARHTQTHAQMWPTEHTVAHQLNTVTSFIFHTLARNCNVLYLSHSRSHPLAHAQVHCLSLNLLKHGFVDENLFADHVVALVV